jgi:hypothetical protein
VLCPLLFFNASLPSTLVFSASFHHHPFPTLSHQYSPPEMAGHAPAEGITETHSPVRTDFAQDVLDSINAVAQPTQPAVEMQPMSSHESSTPAVADPGIDSHESQHNTAQGHTGTSTAQPSSRPGTGGARPDITVAQAPIEDGIGPATDKPHYENLQSSPSGLRLVITLLLHATDTRHPYIIDEGYMRRRNVDVEENDPSNMSVYTLKELIMRDWRPGTSM